MAISEQQRQKKLAKKKQKQKEKQKIMAKKPSLSMTKAKPYAHFPIHECLIPNDLFETGIGELIVTRRAPNGNIAFSAFVIDVFCLGVKDAMFSVASEYDYDEKIKLAMTQATGRQFISIDPSSGKKLLDGLIQYAKDLGFSPHADCKNAYDIFGDIDANASTMEFTYGKDGKPFYINGPYESEGDSRRIINTLIKSCGAGGFDYTVGIHSSLGELDDFDDNDDYDEDDDYDENEQYDDKPDDRNR